MGQLAGQLREWQLQQLRRIGTTGTHHLHTQKIHRFHSLLYRQVGKSVTITVKTSSDVAYVTINGVKVETYKEISSGGWSWGSWGNSGAKTRVFTYTITESAAGTYKYEVYAYNADSARSETAKALTLKVTESNGSSGWWWK